MSAVQVVEQVNRVSLQGEHVSYSVKIADTGKIASLDSINGDFFEDVKTVRDYMIQNATQAIDDLVREAAELAVRTFGTKEAGATLSAAVNEGNAIPEGAETGEYITLPDGKKAHVRQIIPPKT